MKRPPQRQRGYILIVILVLMGVMAIASIQFTARTSGNLKTFAQTRDANQSLLIAENALNTLYAQFAFSADLNGDGIPDNEAPVVLDDADIDIRLPYLYYRGDNSSILATQPTILQSIASSEAIASEPPDHYGHSFSSGLNITLANLYSHNTAPISFEQSNTGSLTVSERRWSEISSNHGKAAAWLEAVQSPDGSGSIRIYVQAVGQYQRARSYVQRYAGEYSQTIGKRLCALCESNTRAPRTQREGDEE